MPPWLREPMFIHYQDGKAEAVSNVGGSVIALETNGQLLPLSRNRGTKM